MSDEGDVRMFSDRSESLAKLAAAKARAQGKFIPLGKDKSATINTRAGGGYSYSYADLAACLASVIPALSEEGIALFQPVHIEAAAAVATTLLVHGESGEWISSDYAAPVADASDARSVGSAATYARRYGLLSMLAIASADEDDDEEQARGGAHEMAEPKGSRACPVCAVVGSIIKGNPQWGGGWVCWKNKGGCGTKWPEGTPFPTQAELMPRTKPAGSPAPPTPVTGSLEDGARCPVIEVGVQCSLHGPHSQHVFMESEEKIEVGTGGPKLTFKIGKKTWATNGMTEAQVMRSFALVPPLDKAKGEGFCRRIIAEILGTKVDDPATHRENFTEDQAATWISRMESALGK